MTGFGSTVPPDDVPAEVDGTAASQATENDFGDGEEALHDSKMPALEDEPTEDEVPAGQHGPTLDVDQG